DKLKDLERMGAKSASNLLTNLENSKKPELSNFIYSLGIRHIGKETASLLAKEFIILDNLKAATLEHLSGIPGIGNITANSIYEYFTNAENLHVLDKLNKYNVVPSQNLSEAENNIDNSLKGLKFVFTGTLEKFTRDQAAREVEMRGGKIVSNVSKATSYVVIGENPGSKYQKAKALNVKILQESEFLEMLLANIS